MGVFKSMPMMLKIKVDESLFLRDPVETELGRSIIETGIKLMDTIGFEQFTFKKLATEIESTEASMYRYFESKHKFLGYLLSWYWMWLSYLVDFKTQNINDPKKLLEILLEILTQASEDDPATAQV
ncbi:MAG: TetR/AcrR family transcriptional regulator [Bdellovibrionota bacterium]